MTTPYTIPRKNLDQQRIVIIDSVSTCISTLAHDEYPTLEDEVLYFIETSILEQKTIIPCLTYFSTGDSTLIEELLSAIEAQKYQEKNIYFAHHHTAILSMLKADFKEAKMDLLTLIQYFKADDVLEEEFCDEAIRKYKMLYECLEDVHDLISKAFGMYACSHDLDEDLKVLEEYYHWNSLLNRFRPTLRN